MDGYPVKWLALLALFLEEFVTLDSDFFHGSSIIINTMTLMIVRI